MRAYDDAARGADPSDDRLARRVDRLAANANAIEGKARRRRRVEKTIEREKTIEGEGDGRRADGGRGRSTDASGASASLTAEERWSLGWVAWTEEAAHVAKVMRDEYHVPANPHATVCSAVLTAHLPMARANAVDRDRGSARASRASKHRRPRRARARVTGDDATRVQREGFVRGCVFRAARRSRDVHANTLRGARRRRTGGRDDAMERDETEDENEHVEAEDVGADIWRDPVGPEARGSVEPPRERRGRGDEFETATRRKSDDAKGRGGASGRERAENGTETGRRRDGGTRRGGGAQRRDGRATRGEDTEYAYLADDGLDPDEPL